MIQRVVLFNTESSINKKLVIKRTKEVLPPIPGVKSLQIGKITNDNYNFGLIILFEDRGALDNFSSHPDHRDYVDNFLKPKINDIVAYNIELF